VFATAEDTILWHIWQTAPNDGWDRWYPFGRDSYRLSYHPVVAGNADGRLELFGRGRPNLGAEVWHLWQTAPNDGWSEPVVRGHDVTSPPTVGRNADGRLEVFAVREDSALWHTWQTAPNNGWA
jgi:hypothetical protein